MSITVIISWFLVYKYPIVFLLALVEGPVIMTLAGFMLRLGYADFWPLYLTLMAGDLVADSLWYGLGYYFAHPLVKKFGRFIDVSEELLVKTTALFQKYPNKILFLSKITMGLGFAMVVLIAAGLSRVPFKKYITFLAIGQIFWTALLMSIGYFFGNFYLVINKNLRLISLFVFVAIVAFLVRGVSRYLRTRNLQNKL